MKLNKVDLLEFFYKRARFRADFRKRKSPRRQNRNESRSSSSSSFGPNFPNSEKSRKIGDERHLARLNSDDLKNKLILFVCLSICLSAFSLFVCFIFLFLLFFISFCFSFSLPLFFLISFYCKTLKFYLIQTPFPHLNFHYYWNFFHLEKK